MTQDKSWREKSTRTRKSRRSRRPSQWRSTMNEQEQIDELREEIAALMSRIDELGEAISFVSDRINMHIHCAKSQEGESQ